MQNKNIYLGVIILVALLAGVCLYYFIKIEKLQTPQIAKPSQNSQTAYDTKNVTYDMAGYVKEIKGNLISLEDKTPQPPTKKDDGNSPKIIEIKLAKDGIVAKGDEYITLQDIKAGDYVLLKTNIENNELTAKEIYILSSQSETKQ